jgi:uncharacterized membrane protein YqaE (UPF0057 family)
MLEVMLARPLGRGWDVNSLLVKSHLFLVTTTLGRVDGLFEGLGALEFYAVGGGDLDGLPGPGVDSGASRPLGDGEGTQSCDGDGARIFDFTANRVDEASECFVSLGLGNLGFLRDLGYQFGFGHRKNPSLKLKILLIILVPPKGVTRRPGFSNKLPRLNFILEIWTWPG